MMERNVTAEIERIAEFNRLISNVISAAGSALSFEIEYTTFFNVGFCDCRLLSRDLRILFQDLVSEGSETFKWNAFDNFVRKYVWNHHRMFSVDGTVAPKNCSLKICSMLLQRVESSLRCGIALPTIFKTVMENFGNISNCVVDSLESSLSSSKSCTSSVILAALHDHSNFVNLLLNFGFISSKRNDLHGLQIKCHGMIRGFIWMWADRSRSNSMAKEAIKLSKKALFYSTDEERSKRMFWATVAIRATQLSLKNEDDTAKDFVYYLKACFAATTDPFLTVFEVRSLLYACFSVVKKIELFDTYSQEFDKLMPECPVKIEPRRLSDLARCQVRQNLSNSSLPLPSAVQQVRLPDTLKSFVLGNIFYNSTSRKRKHDSSQEAEIKTKLARLLFE